MNPTRQLPEIPEGQFSITYLEMSPKTEEMSQEMEENVPRNLEMSQEMNEGMDDDLNISLKDDIDIKIKFIHSLLYIIA